MESLSANLARRALVTHLRQELVAPAEALCGFAEMLLEDARRLGLAAVEADLKRIDGAARQLLSQVNHLLDGGGLPAGDDGAESEQTRRRLRHDLRTPINAIRGYGEMLLEDLEGSEHQPLIDGLHKIGSAADDLLLAIDAIIRTPDETGRGEAASLAAQGMIESLVTTLQPGLPVTPLAAGRILVIDDTPQNREVLEHRLTRDGHHVVTVASGAEALARVEADEFDLILLDMIMPGMNGFEVLMALKLNARTRPIPVIMISALDEVNSIARCIELGAEDYLQKPFNATVLRARIGACLEKKRLRDIERLHVAALESELTLARNVQMSMLPTSFPAFPGYDAHGLMIPAKDVGGDLFDYIPLDDDPDRIGIAIGDVSGKGVPAAFFMSMVCSLLRLTASFGLSPAACLSKVNDLLCKKNDQMMFVTLVYGILDRRDGVFTYSSAGHNPPLLLRAGSAPEWLNGTDGPPLGTWEGRTYRERSLRLWPGDTLLLYTDGVTEARDVHDEMFDEPRLEQAAVAARESDVRRVAESLVEAVKKFEVGAPQADDITCVVLRRTGDAGHRSQELTLAADPDLPRLVAEAFGGFAGACTLPLDIAADVQIALDETTSNVVKYAASSTVTVRWRLEPHELIVEIEDEGVPFDPLSLPPPTIGGDIVEREPGGLGIFFVRSLMDAVEYGRCGARNRLRLAKKLP